MVNDDAVVDVRVRVVARALSRPGDESAGSRSGSDDPFEQPPRLILPPQRVEVLSPPHPG